MRNKKTDYVPMEEKEPMDNMKRKNIEKEGPMDNIRGRKNINNNLIWKKIETNTHTDSILDI